MLCVGKRRRDDAQTVLAAGGINAALGTMDPEDSWQQHAADTIADLVAYGADLAREPDGRLTQRFFGAHTYRRTCFAGDYTGREIQRALVRRASRCGRFAQPRCRRDGGVL